MNKGYFMQRTTFV